MKRRLKHRRRKTNKNTKNKKKRKIVGAKARFVVLKIKDWKGARGPAQTVLGSAKTLAEARRIVDRGTRSGLHAIVDSKTGKAWTAYVAREYRFRPFS